jgi:GTP cyclohydrolase I
MISQHIAEVLKELGVDDKPDFIDTPKRIERMYLDFFHDHSDDIMTLFKRTFHSDANQMVVVPDIPCHGMCPHHLLPVSYTISLGYIPRGEVIGLSKIPRIVKMAVKYPDLQENITSEVVDLFWYNLKTDGVMAVVKGIHTCMACRGVEVRTPVVTSAFKGSFQEQRVREEFLDLIK